MPAAAPSAAPGATSINATTNDSYCFGADPSSLSDPKSFSKASVSLAEDDSDNNLDDDDDSTHAIHGDENESDFPNFDDVANELPNIANSGTPGSVSSAKSSSTNASGSASSCSSSASSAASARTANTKQLTAPIPNRARRTSVSAESIDPTKVDPNYKPVVIPKTDSQRERIAKAVANNFLFKDLDEEQYRDVINAMAEKRVPAGEWVIRQGQAGDFFYVNETGTLDVYVNNPNLKTNFPQPAGGPPAPPADEPTFVAGKCVTSYDAGASFGELALMYNSPRAASVVATSPCVLWALDRVTFRRILLDHTSRKRRLYESFLEGVSLLKGLDSYERLKIADALEPVAFNDGDVVIRQGDIGENFYIIESGTVSVSKVDEKGAEYKMKGLGSGDYFGELALLNDTPRQATLTAQGKLKCATLGKKAFTRLLGPLIDIMKRNEKQYEHYPGELPGVNTAKKA